MGGPDHCCNLLLLLMGGQVDAAQGSLLLMAQAISGLALSTTDRHSCF